MICSKCKNGNLKVRRTLSQSNFRVQERHCDNCSFKHVFVIVAWEGPEQTAHSVLKELTNGINGKK